ncbi:hypothetical protein [Burkholderia gladioli]|uniref:hypothetical protein n=1 Tax=Burkholderia gladioli TaxID=28095 RepID=UPI00163F15A7|nr:hypothetical protein [Burkholderia gladioli]
MNLNDVKKLEEARQRFERATIALAEQRNQAKSNELAKVIREFKEYFTAADFKVVAAPHGYFASTGQLTFKLETDGSDRFGAFGLVKITPPPEMKEEPVAILLVRKQAADGPSITVNAGQVTPLQEMEKKAASMEAALQKPFPEIRYVIQAPTDRTNVDRQFESFTAVLTALYPNT